MALGENFSFTHLVKVLRSSLLNVLEGVKRVDKLGHCLVVSWLLVHRVLLHEECQRDEVSTTPVLPRRLEQPQVIAREVTEGHC